MSVRICSNSLFGSLILAAGLIGAAVTPNELNGQTDQEAARRMEETSRTFFETLNAGEMEAWLGTMSRNVVTYEPVGSPPNRGHEGVMGWAAANAEMGFRSVTVEVHEVIVAGSSTAIIWTTHFVLPNGSTVDIPGVDIHEFNDEFLIEIVHGYFDPMPLMAAMGQGG